MTTDAAALPLKLIDDAGADVGAVDGHQGLFTASIALSDDARIGTKIEISAAIGPDDRCSLKFVADGVVVGERSTERLLIPGAGFSSEKIFDVELIQGALGC